MFQAKVVEEIKTHFMSNNFIPENRAIYEILWENMVVSERPHITILYGACALHPGQPWPPTHTHNM
jgi:hypothetical protein